MARLIETQDRARIEEFLRRDRPLHLYEIGDLDPFFWPSTTWFAWEDDHGAIEAMALRYTNPSGVTLLALDRSDNPALDRLIDAIRDRLPDRFFAHLRPGLGDRLESTAGPRAHASATPPRWRVAFRLDTNKMFLTDPSRLDHYPSPSVVRFLPSDLDSLKAFYTAAYPENWFDPRMVDTGQYFGIRENGIIVAVAGIHVYSPEYGVAALGNIATHPEHRGRGLGTQVTAALCRSLLESVDSIGLNVHADNGPAIRCYEKLGFTLVAPYEEVMFAPFA